MTTKISGTGGVEFPDATTQAKAAVVDAPLVIGSWTYGQASSNGTVNLGASMTPGVNLGSGWASNKFQPNVAGYYQVNLSVQFAATTFTYIALQIRKNGTILALDVDPAYATAYGAASISCIVYLDGTTDYLELYQDVSCTGAITIAASHFSTALVRKA